MHIILPRAGLLSVATVSEATHALVDHDSPGRALRCCGDAHRQPLGAVLKPNEQDRGERPHDHRHHSQNPERKFLPFSKTRSQKGPQPAIAQGLSVDRRAGLQDQASRHSHDRTRLGETTSWTDDGRQDRLDKLDGFGAGEGARTLDPDLGKVVLYH